MDWYIFLAPLLLLPIIFLFRLVGCTLDTAGTPVDGGDGDGGDGARSKNITFKLVIVDLIPVIDPNPIWYIWPKFTIDPGEPDEIQVPYSPPQTITPGTEIPALTILESDPVAASPETHTCSCDVFITRFADPNRDQPPGDGHLIGPVTVDLPGDINQDIAKFDLNYNQTSPFDVLPGDFSLNPTP